MEDIEEGWTLPRNLTGKQTQSILILASAADLTIQLNGGHELNIDRLCYRNTRRRSNCMVSYKTPSLDFPDISYKDAVKFLTEKIKNKSL